LPGDFFAPGRHLIFNHLEIVSSADEDSPGPAPARACNIQVIADDCEFVRRPGVFRPHPV
jgi:hypothetical protein